MELTNLLIFLEDRAGFSHWKSNVMPRAIVTLTDVNTRVLMSAQIAAVRALAMHPSPKAVKDLERMPAEPKYHEEPFLLSGVEQALAERDAYMRQYKAYQEALKLKKRSHRKRINSALENSRLFV